MRFGRGERDVAFPEVGVDEIRKLAGNFQVMAVAVTAGEAELRKRAEELQRSNRDLDAFTYSVSHDLRAPLRAINGFSRILLEDCAQDLSGDAARYLQLVRESAVEMGNMVDDLLAFSRYGRQAIQTQPIVLADVARKALEELQPDTEGRQVQITIGDMGSANGDPALIKQVFVNLLSNALKFTRPRQPAIIEVGRLTDRGSTYFVKDNGVGFDMQYVDKLFGVFQRLHRAEEFEGTGAGLAIVQRIILRHGGRVWAEGAVGVGATFYFRLEGGESDD
jgi:light-regulated signal transduction histidine kinase (bacteriophytochrome)